MSAQAQQNTGSNGFISSFQDFLGNLGKIGLSAAEEVIPIWASKQLGLQQKNQLNQSTFQGQPQANTTAISSQETSPQGPAIVQRAGLPFNLDAKTLVIAGAVGAGLYLIARRR